jgi:hypothetical protein
MHFPPAAAAFVLGFLTLSVAQSQAQQFVLSSKDRARLIAVDFAAVGADGLPAADLRADEVTLSIDGRSRPIRSLEYVSLTSAASAGTDLLLPYGSNAQADGGRSVVLIIDQETIRPGREAALKSEIAAFLRRLGPSDRVALMTVPYGGLKVDLTSEHHRITLALTTIGGQASAVETEGEAACRTSTTLAALRGTLDDLRGGEAPVIVVFFSGQMSPPHGVQAAPVPTAGLQSFSRCQIRPEQFKQVSAAAATARAQFYIVQPELSVTPQTRAGLEHLAGVTGGLLLPLGGGDGSALARVTRESAGYYVARVEPDPSETTGTIKNLRISVARSNITVRQRPQMSVIRTTARFVNAAAGTPLDMMKQARVFRDLPLRVTGYTSREPGSPMVRVITMFDSPDPAAALDSAMVGLFDETGRMVASRQFSSAELTGSPVVAALAVPPGHYRLRVAAAEATGRGGAADYDVTAELSSAGPLTLSALVVGLSRGGGFSPRLEFGSEASAMAHVEIYGAAAGESVGAVFELARSANGPALVTLQGTFAATTDPDRFIVTAALPIGALTPGDYVVRATVAAQDKPGGRVLRALRKVAR